ncbi:radical SAM protein [Mesorhizobium sp. M0220]|uniref:B12-binding domain-containing radical SAM protein n=1 Tax=unclassified Mesorhizobium TaxID=325217 RepID=UPI00333839A7
MARREKATEIALVNVPYGSADGERSMRPLGLSYLGAFLADRGVRAKGFDFSDSSMNPTEIVERYRLADYPVVGLSFYNINAKAAYRLAEAVKARNPHCVVVGGGPHASAAHATLFERHPEIDLVVRNEGEETLLEVIEALRCKLPLSGISGISYMSGGRSVIAPDRSRLENLDDLPAPAFDFQSETEENPLFYFDRVSGTRKRAVGLVSSRSCPYSCSFCAIILIGRQWRKASAAKVVSDLKELEARNGLEYGHIYFLDANFFVNAKRALEVAESLHCYRADITFSFSTRVNQLIKGKSLLSELQRLGLRAVELGIESGSRDALKRFAKDTTPEQNDEALHLLKSHGIQLIFDFIMFDAEANLNDLRRNVDMIERNNLDYHVPWEHIFSHMTPYLGTDIRLHYEKMMGHAFDEDELPHPSDLFQDPQVKAVFDELSKLHAHVPNIAQALFRTEARVRGSASWGRDEAREKLNAVTLRRLPFLVLRNLLSQARQGETVSLARAIPPFTDEAGSSYDLEEFLHWAAT